jgi:hypothetical protein
LIFAHRSSQPWGGWHWACPLLHFTAEETKNFPEGRGISAVFPEKASASLCHVRITKRETVPDWRRREQSGRIGKEDKMRANPPMVMECRFSSSFDLRDFCANLRLSSEELFEQTRQKIRSSPMEVPSVAKHAMLAMRVKHWPTALKATATRKEDETVL